MATSVGKITKPTDVDRIGNWLMTQVDTVLNDAITVPIQQLTTAIFPIITIGLTIQFLLYTIMIARGHGNMTVTELTWKAIRVAFIAGIATSGGLFQTDISKVMVSLPDDVAGIVAGGQTISAQVDTLRQRTESAASKLEDKEKSWFPSSREIMASVYALVLSVLTAILAGVISVLMIVVKVGMTLVVATGPIFIPALLFERTERMFDSWVAQALNFVVLGLLAGLIMAILVQIALQYIAMMIELVSRGDVALFSLLGGYFLVALACLVVIIMLPGLAQGLSGGFGANFGANSVGRGAMSYLRFRTYLNKATGKK